MGTCNILWFTYYLFFLGLFHSSVSSFGKDSDTGRDWGQEENGTIEDEMAEWHHWLNGQWTVWVNSGSWWWTSRPGMLQSWGRKQTWLSNWTELWAPWGQAHALFLFFMHFLHCNFPTLGQWIHFSLTLIITKHRGNAVTKKRFRQGYQSCVSRESTHITWLFSFLKTDNNTIRGKTLILCT